jgi:hypothetical protein
MTRSRLFVLVSSAVVAVGVLAGLGAHVLDSARAAVGPLPAEALVLPADSRFVMGFDVKRFTASPLYARYASERGMRPEALGELEERTGLDPTRDVDRIIVAGTGVDKTSKGLVLAQGRFDLYRLGRTLETAPGGKVATWNHEGVAVHVFDAEKQEPGAIAFLDEETLLFGSRERVLAALSSRTRGEAPLRSNLVLMGLLERVRPGSTFWMVGDQSLLSGVPASVPAPGGEGAEISLPALRSLVVTGDLDPQVTLSVTGEAADETAAGQLADVVRGLVAMASLQARQRPELAQLGSAVSVTTEKNRVLLSARIPYEMIDALKRKPVTAPEAKEPADPSGDGTKPPSG